MRPLRLEVAHLDFREAVPSELCLVEVLEPITASRKTVASLSWKPALHTSEDMTVTESAASFTAMVADVRSRATWLAYHLTGESSAAEDVVAEALARVWPHWQKGSIEYPWQYVRRAVTNEAMNHHRRRRRLERFVPPDDDVEADHADTLDDRELISFALADLPTLQRDVLRLRYYDDMSEIEIATRLGVSRGAVKSAAARGLRRLRDRLATELAA